MKQMVIAHFKDKSKRSYTIMFRALDDDLEERLDDNDKTMALIDDQLIPNKNLLVYGKLDLEEPLLHDLDLKVDALDSPFFIRGGFNYKNGTVDEKVSMKMTHDNLEIIKYCHARLNYPEKIVIYKRDKKYTKAD